MGCWYTGGSFSVAKLDYSAEEASGLTECEPGAVDHLSPAFQCERGPEQRIEGEGRWRSIYGVRQMSVQQMMQTRAGWGTRYCKSILSNHDTPGVLITAWQLRRAPFTYAGQALERIYAIPSIATFQVHSTASSCSLFNVYQYRPLLPIPPSRSVPYMPKTETKNCPTARNGLGYVVSCTYGHHRTQCDPSTNGPAL